MGADQQASPSTRREGLETEVQWLKGIGPRHAQTLAKVKLNTAGDVLAYYPRRYEDRTNLPAIRMLRSGQQATVRGRLTKVNTRPTRGGKVAIRATLDDGTAEVDLLWFNQPWVRDQLSKVKGDVIAFGIVKEGRGNPEIHSPEWEELDIEEDAEGFARIVPVYPLKEGVPQWLVRKAAHHALVRFCEHLVEPLPSWLRKEYDLPSIHWCVTQMHRPASLEDQQRARACLAFEEFLALQLMLQLKRRSVKQELGIAFAISSLAKEELRGTDLFAGRPALAEGKTLWDEVHQMLPFELTAAQDRVIREVWADMEQPVPMNRLLQGDVGSGKTAVALCAILAAVRCGYQAALMAPTEILAEQHYINFHRMLDPLGVRTVLMVGKLNAKDKRRAHTMASLGTGHVLVGTHALIQEEVKFAKLGLAVIDEQHRFGVLQRAALRSKGGGLLPDVLVMTATPIPRTLTMSYYGDLDVSVIDELPPGRMPIKTHLRGPHERDKVYQGVRELLAKGRQAYFVCPVITESEKLQTQAAEDLYYRLSHQVFPEFQVGLLHGQMKPIEKEEVMERFRKGELHALVSTVVIEVGVDVPNATVMVVEDANRFGLSQLHQLRGRVGRGDHQSYCVLIADAQTEEARSRMAVLVRTTDGFEIAEEDWRLRGPGDVAGTRQHGELDFGVASLLTDGVLLERARNAARKLLDMDPELALPEHQSIVRRMRERFDQHELVSVS